MDARMGCQAFAYQPADSLLVVKEQHLADANFVFAYLLKQTLSEANNKVVLLLTHNSLPHYECMAKKLGYDLVSNVQTGSVKIIDFQDLIRQQLDNYFNVYEHLKVAINELMNDLSKNDSMNVFIFIDDFTHIQDCTQNANESINLLNNMIGSYYNNAKVKFIVGLHIGDERDKILSSDLEYSADCIVDISLMKTGRSDDISGVLKVLRNRKLVTLHYKVKEYGVDISAPGNFLIS